MTATFEPALVDGGASMMTLHAAADAVGGVYDFLIVGTAAGKRQTFKVTLHMAAQTLAARFDIAVNATQVGIDRATGTTASVPVSVTRQGGFAEPITFSAENLPAGMAATWSVNPVSGMASTQNAATTLTLTAGPTVPAGTYSVTIRAVSGTQVITRTVAVTVTAAPVAGAPDFSLRLVYDGGDPMTANGATLYIDRANGYSGPVTLSYPSVQYGPVILVDGKPWTSVVYGTTARITASALGRIYGAYALDGNGTRALTSAAVTDNASRPGYVWNGTLTGVGTASTPGTAAPTRTVPVRTVWY